MIKKTQSSPFSGRGNKNMSLTRERLKTVQSKNRRVLNTYKKNSFASHSNQTYLNSKSPASKQNQYSDIDDVVVMASSKPLLVKRLSNSQTF